VPTVRPLRALRYDPRVAGDPARLICPPYDVISEERQRELAARDPHNAVHLELPPVLPGDGPDDRYRRAATALAEWRTAGILRKETEPAVHLYEQTWQQGETGESRSQRGLLVRLRLEPFGPDSGVRPHERTMGGPKEDRYRLLKATGTNLSPVVGLYDSGEARSADLLTRLASAPCDVDATDDDGVRHRLWTTRVSDPERGGVGSELLALAASSPITIADGHHRYETALRYRDERALRRSCQIDPPYEFVLALLYDLAATEPTILPTHRLVRGGPTGGALWTALEPLFESQPVVDGAALAAAFGGPAEASGIGLWSGGLAGTLRPRRDALERLLPAGSEAVRWLDVSVVSAILERVSGIDDGAARAGERLGYTHDAQGAIALVESGSWDACFLVRPTPVRSVLEVAAAGDLMPQKTTYFHPKAATGFVFCPMEW
jgi:uncharacterized protein (DUF1015 family)